MNPFTRRISGWAPWFGTLTVTGRKSGRRISIPLNVFSHDGEYVFALTYGSDVNWVKNVLASGTAELRRHGRTIHLEQPRLFKDPQAEAVPLPVGLSLLFLGVEEFLAMRPVEPHRRPETT